MLPPGLPGIQAELRAGMVPEQPASTTISATSAGLNMRTPVGEHELILDCDGQAVASAELFFSFVPADRFSPGFRDEVLEGYLARLGSTAPMNSGDLPQDR